MDCDSATLTPDTPAASANSSMANRPSQALQAFAFCSRAQDGKTSAGGVTLLLVNPGNVNHTLHMDVHIGPLAAEATRVRDKRHVFCRGSKVVRAS